MPEFHCQNFIVLFNPDDAPNRLVPQMRHHETLLAPIIFYDNTRNIVMLGWTMKSDDTQQIVSALGALAHEHRLALYRLLVERGPDGLSAGVIAQHLNVPPSSLTFHLQQLLHAGLVTQRRISRQLFYAADFSAMNRLVTYLTKNCCGQGEACSPVCLPGGGKSFSSKETGQLRPNAMEDLAL